MEDMLILLYILLAIVVLGIFGYILKRIIVKNGLKIKPRKNDSVKYIKEGNVAINNEYLNREEIKFLEFINKIITKEYVVYPKVGVENIVKPIGNRMLYNSILGTYVDYCMFEKSTMKPILVLDIYDNSFGDEPLTLMSQNITEILKKVNLPILSIQVKDKYNEEEIKQKIRYTLDDSYRAMLQKEEQNKM